MKRRALVYIAGPITKGDHPVNIRNGIDAYHKLLTMNAVPFCPHMDFLYRLVYPDGVDYNGLLEYDKQIILRCDCVMRIPGESKGADIEEQFAKANSIPFFNDWEKLAMWIINFNEQKEFNYGRRCCGFPE